MKRIRASSPGTRRISVRVGDETYTASFTKKGEARVSDEAAGHIVAMTSCELVPEPEEEETE